MTAAELVAAVEARGLRLRADGSGIAVRPAGALTPAERAALKADKPDVLAFLRGRAFGVPWDRVSLHRLDRVLELEVPWSDVRLVLAPGCRIARELRAQDHAPGRVWCACEVLDLLLSGVTPERRMV